jgi:hypothetical protein
LEQFPAPPESVGKVTSQQKSILFYSAASCLRNGMLKEYENSRFGNVVFFDDLQPKEQVLGENISQIAISGVYPARTTEQQARSRCLAFEEISIRLAQVFPHYSDSGTDMGLVELQKSIILKQNDLVADGIDEGLLCVLPPPSSDGRTRILDEEMSADLVESLQIAYGLLGKTELYKRLREFLKQTTPDQVVQLNCFFNEYVDLDQQVET